MKRLIAATLLLWAAATVTARTITVDPAGGGDGTTLQQAIALVPDDSPEQTVIHLRAGLYAGQIVLPKHKANVWFEGDGESKSIIRYDRNVRDPLPPGVDPQFIGAGVVILADDFRASRVGFENDSGDRGQAMALRIDGDRAVLDRCNISGWQDTLLINKGRQYFTNCTIAGRVDFIYGSATAVFDHCDIHSRNGGHVTAASTPKDHAFGFVFLNCTLTGDDISWSSPSATRPSRVTLVADLGRPWRPYASVAFLNCTMGKHIAAVGWDNWQNPANEATVRYAEFNTTGPGANPAGRVQWARQLSSEEAAGFTVAAVLGGADHWKPAASRCY